MLLDIIHGTDSGGIILIKDTVEYCGRPILKTFLKEALDSRKEAVHVLAFEVSEDELRSGLDHPERLCFHDGYTDPLGWNSASAFTVQQFIHREISAHLKQSESGTGQVAVLLIDSLSWLLRHHPPAFICQQLQALRRGGVVRNLVLLLHSDLHQQGVVDSVCHLANIVVSVEPTASNGHVIAKTIKRTKSGKVTQAEETFSVNEDFSVTVHMQPLPHGKQQAEPYRPQTDPAASLTFNLWLSEEEKEAREKLSLPFVFTSEKKSALLQHRPGAGRIIYEPDASDDFDQEDPDDDLDV